MDGTAIAIAEQLKDPLLISSKTGYGIHRLKNTIMALLKNG
jgi:hypothetical protein